MLIGIHMAIQALLIVRALLRPNRDPAARVAWVAVILSLPVAGILSYLLLGETRIGRSGTERLRAAIAKLPDPATIAAPFAREDHPEIADAYKPLFRVGQSISGYQPVGANAAELMADSDAMIDRLVRDVDAATSTVHVMFYIWLADGNGTRVAEALMRAAARGVTCRAMVDDLGSRRFIKSPLWDRMGEAGVKLGRALQIGNPLVRVLTGRIDLRNHRKIVVIDNRITYCGSQNCADPAFLVKAKFAPWVDAVLRLTGPVVIQNQHLFAVDWMSETGEDISGLVQEPAEPVPGGFTAQVIASGPTARASAAPEMFESLMYGARQSLVITTPYYVPVELDPGSIAGRGEPRRQHDHHPARTKRRFRRRRRKPQLLRRSVARGGEDL